MESLIHSVIIHEWLSNSLIIHTENTKQFVKNTPLRVIFSTIFSVFHLVMKHVLCWTSHAWYITYKQYWNTTYRVVKSSRLPAKIAAYLVSIRWHTDDIFWIKYPWTGCLLWQLSHLLAISELRRDLGQVSNLFKLIDKLTHHIKGHVEIGYLTNFNWCSRVEQGSSHNSWNMVKDPYFVTASPKTI